MSHRVARTYLCLGLTLALTPGLCPARADAVYSVGNSLTWDFQPQLLADSAQTFGISHSHGYHINCGASLTETVANPNLNCIQPNAFGRYEDALPGHAWDAVTLQPYFSEATILSETDAILSLIDLTRSNPANADTVFYIYTGWPPRGATISGWEAPTPDFDPIPADRNRDVMNHIFNRVASQTDAELRMIPVGEVLYRVAQEIEAGTLPGVDHHRELYRDKLHLHYRLGRYVAHATTLATLYNQPTFDLNDPWYSLDDTEPPEPLIPPGDFNTDGFVGQGDLDLVLLNWGGAEAPAGWDPDLVFDGQMSQNELDELLLNWGNGDQPGPALYPAQTFAAIDAIIWDEVGKLMLAGDLNNDAVVSQGDLDLTLLNWGDDVVPEAWGQGEPFDGAVSQNELDDVLLNWGAGITPATHAVPEPGAALLLGGPGLFVARRRKVVA